jgi:apolipoprotein N-acyltransferase
MVFFIGHLWWITKLLPASSITLPWLMVPAVVTLALYLSVYPGLTLWLVNKLGRGNALAALFLTPALWAFFEIFRSGSEFGFSWGAIGYSLVALPSLMQGAAWVGVFGLGAFVVLVNLLWANAFISKHSKGKGLFFAAGVVLLAANFIHGKRVISRFDADSAPVHHTVAIAQPNVDLEVKWMRSFRDSTFRLIGRLAREAALAEPELLIFPETSAPVYLPVERRYRFSMTSLVRELDLPIYIGFLDGRYEGPDSLLNVYNSSGLISPDGTLVKYDKMHLLPFGEAVPYAWKFPFLSGMDFGQANFHPGPNVDPIPSPIGGLAPLICFESIFPNGSRRFVQEGADVLVNITNDGWFGDTPGPYQHNDMAILRAVENRRYLLRSANTGVSMVVDPVGRVVAAIGLLQEGLLIAKIRPIEGQTFYTRHGNIPVLLANIVLLAAGIVVGGRAESRRRNGL